MLPSLVPANVGRPIHIVVNGACRSAIITDVIPDDAYHPKRFIDPPPPPAVRLMFWNDQILTQIRQYISFHPHQDYLNGTWHFAHHINPAGIDEEHPNETRPLHETAS